MGPALSGECADVGGAYRIGTRAGRVPDEAGQRRADFLVDHKNQPRYYQMGDS